MGNDARAVGEIGINLDGLNVILQRFLVTPLTVLDVGAVGVGREQDASPSGIIGLDRLFQVVDQVGELVLGLFIALEPQIGGRPALKRAAMVGRLLEGRVELLQCLIVETVGHAVTAGVGVVVAGRPADEIAYHVPEYEAPDGEEGHQDDETPKHPRVHGAPPSR